MEYNVTLGGSLIRILLKTCSTKFSIPNQIELYKSSSDFKRSSNRKLHLLLGLAHSSSNIISSMAFFIVSFVNVDKIADSPSSYKTYIVFIFTNQLKCITQQCTTYLLILEICIGWKRASPPPIFLLRYLHNPSKNVNNVNYMDNETPPFLPFSYTIKWVLHYLIIFSPLNIYNVYTHQKTYWIVASQFWLELVLLKSFAFMTPHHVLRIGHNDCKTGC